MKHQACPFFPHFFARQTKVLDLHPLICSPRPALFFVNADINMKNFNLGLKGAIHIGMPCLTLIFLTEQSNFLGAHPQ